MIRWNSSKHYLLELEDRGVPVVPTKIFRDIESTLPALPGLFPDSSRLVLKPAVSASAELTYLVDRSEGPEEKVRAIFQRGDLLVQPFLESIGADGELSLIFFPTTRATAFPMRF